MEEAVKGVVRDRGPITFAQFMELALYAPGRGYYATGEDRVGPQGDFYTSPATHPIFGALVSLQLEEMAGLLGYPRPFTVVELGGGKGLLAQDIVGYSRNLSGEFQDCLRYISLDPARPSSPRGFQPIIGRGVPFRGVVGTFLSNELLDAFPCHRVVMGEKLREIYVGVKDGKLADVLGELSSPHLEEQLKQEGITLGEGQEAEVCLELGGWMEEVAAALERGFVITIDYGRLAPNLYSPQRRRGSLRTCYRHTPGEDPYLRVGQQDLSSFVDFTALIEAGARAGLTPLGLVTQRSFLLNLGLQSFIRAVEKERLSPLEHNAHRFALNELIKPGEMGDFLVLIQGKGVGKPRLSGLIPDSPIRGAGEGLPFTRESPRPLSLFLARYPHWASLSQTWQNLFPGGGDEGEG